MATRRVLGLLALWIVSTSITGSASAREPVAPALTHEHRHPTGGFVFRTPDDWTVAEVSGRPGVLEASSGMLRVRFVWYKGDQGYDSAHVMCMLERLSSPMDAEPQMRYEYDFISGTAGERRFLDSAYEVRYDQPVMGQKEWRQRALTIVSEGDALCVMSAAPRAAWKKKATRAVLDGILMSLTFPRPAPLPRP